MCDAKIMWNFYDGITRAQVNLGDTISSVSKTFAVLPDDNKALKIILDIIGMSFAMVAAPCWNLG